LQFGEEATIATTATTATRSTKDCIMEDDEHKDITPTPSPASF
jgi:hypothetical protein